MPFKLHAVVIKKELPFKKAQKIAKDIIKDDNKKFYRIETNTFRFRNISKQKFKPKSFKSKKVNDKITLVFGELKK